MSRISSSPTVAKARKNPDYRYDIAMLRLLAIVIVVYFHGYLIPYDGFHMPSISGLYRDIYEPFNHYYFIFVAMSLFTFISGFLFGGQLLRKTPISFAYILKTKAIRLLLPFYIFTILFSLTLRNFNVDMLITGIFDHLWFLPMLFWCFIITYFLRPLIYSKHIIIQTSVLVVLFVWSLFANELAPPTFMSLQAVPCWLCWFVFGAWFYAHEKRLCKIPLGWRYVLIVSGLIIYLVSTYEWPLKYHPFEARTIPSIIGSIAAIMALWSIFTMIPWKSYIITDYLLALSACSFGIYIFHKWLNEFPVCTSAKALIPIEQFAADHIYLFPLIFSTASFLLSLGITWFLLKFKVCRKLIG